MKRRRTLTLASAAAAAALAAVGCGGGARTSVCSNGDGALTEAAFVVVEAPVGGARVSSGFRVSGCSSTYEATIEWSLRARDGRVLAQGSAHGGGLTPTPFRFTVRYHVVVRQIGELSVGAPDVTREGYAPSRTALPLVLRP